MSRTPSSQPLTPSLTGLTSKANDVEDILDYTPRQWFEKARHEADKAVLAERTGKPEDMFVAYVRTCTTYSRVKAHPSWKDEKAKDAQWAARVKDFMNTYEAYLKKAKTIKEKLQAKQTNGTNGIASNGSQLSDPRTTRPSASRQPSGPDAKALGSIADRMRMLQNSGMQADSSYKRVSHDMGKTAQASSGAPVAAERNKSTTAGTSNTGGAGNFGPSRIAGSNQRDETAAGAQDGAKEKTRSRSGSEAVQPPPTQTVQNGTHETKAAKSDEDAELEARFAAIAARTSKLRLEEDEANHAGPSKLPTPPSAPVQTPQSSAQPPASTDPRWDPQGPTRTPSLPQPPSIEPNTPRSPHFAKEIIPADLPHNPPRPDPPARPASTDNVEDFEKAFPSLSEFSKQYEDPPPGAFAFEVDPDSTNEVSGLPNVRPSRPEEARETWRQAIHEEPTDLDFNLPDVSRLPDLPSLPSVPASKPGLPVPPAKPDELKGDTLGPPSPDMNADIKRAASVPNVTTLPGSPGEPERAPTLPSARSPLGPRAPYANGLTSPPPTASGSGSGRHAPGQSLSFPVPQPTSASQPANGKPPAGSSSVSPKPLEKPKFPLTNSIECDVLRSYLIDPAVDVVLLDVRMEEDTKRGYVGLEYENRGKEIKNVWLDPHVVMREGMNSNRLEDALSLSPDAQRRAFEARDKADIVVVYDSSSQNWPRKDSALDGKPPPLARMWDIIYGEEFNKRLQRTPVLLRGGYDAWVEFIKRRGRENAKWHAEQQARMAQANGHAHAHGRNGIPNGHGPPPPPPGSRGRERSESNGESKRANRDTPVYQESRYAKNIADSMAYAPQSMTGESSYTGQRRNYIASPPPASSSSRAHHAPSSSLSHYASPSIAPPPQASIHPGPGARRRSDYVEQHNQVYSGYNPSRPSIDYPQAHALTPIPQPPPVAQGHVSERYDRSAVVRSTSMRGLDQVAKEGDDVQYWNDVVLGLTGLKNLGNTCYMNSTLQCLSATYPFTSYFLDGSYKRSINVYNPMGMKGNLANAFAELLKALWKEDYTFLSPVTFRKQIISFSHQFSGTEQHDSQEFLSFVLDGLHEDLNRIKHKPPPVEMSPEREAKLETLPPEVASETEWQIYKQRNDSFIVDLFQGQYRNRLECLTCHKTSTTYDTFMYLSLPVPSNKSKVVVQELIDEFVKVEIMTGDDAWNCPRCKVPRRATKTLTISRLPPVLLIQLKRFSTTNGVFWDKSETPVIFPIKDLDLTRYIPYRQATGKEDLDDPRTQIGPFKYDLYGVSNHMGTLSSGHYTAYVKSSKGWMYCEDSRVSKAQDRDVVSRPAYILFYKRIRV